MGLTLLQIIHIIFNISLTPLILFLLLIGQIPLDIVYLIGISGLYILMGIISIVCNSLELKDGYFESLGIINVSVIIPMIIILFYYQIMLSIYILSAFLIIGFLYAVYRLFLSGAVWDRLTCKKETKKR